jgi:hypothetical protein
VIASFPKLYLLLDYSDWSNAKTRAIAIDAVTAARAQV